MEESKKKVSRKRLAIITALTILILGGIGYLVVGQKIAGIKTYSRSEIAERDFFKVFGLETPEHLRGIEILSHTVDSSKNEHRITLKNNSGEAIRYIEIDIFKKDADAVVDAIDVDAVVDAIAVINAWPSGSDSFQSGTTQTITTIDHNINTSHDYIYEIFEVEFE